MSRKIGLTKESTQHRRFIPISMVTCNIFLGSKKYMLYQYQTCFLEHEPNGTENIKNMSLSGMKYIQFANKKKTCRDPHQDHLPYISKAVARSKYEEPNNCKTDPGIEAGCAKNGNSLELFPDPLSLNNTCEPVDFCKFLSHAVLKNPSVIFVELSVPY